MKLLKKDITEKDGSGEVRLEAEQQEDMYTLYNLISEGDSVRTVTLRKVTKEASGKEKQSKTMRMALTISVEKIDFDTDVCELRLSGPCEEGTEFVATGQYHTLVLETQRSFTLKKQRWDAIFLEALEDATSPERNAEVAAIVMQVGLAQICLITGNMTIVKSRIEKKMPKGHAQKRFGKTDKALEKFFQDIYRAFLVKVDLGRIKCVIMGSPGTLNEEFLSYMMERATKENDDVITKSRSKFCVVPVTSGHKHALEEALSNPTIVKRIGDTKAVGELAALATFKTYLGNDDKRACYGFGHVSRATELAAVDTLLLTDSLFRSRDLKTRKQYVDLVEGVRQTGGTARVLSSMHVSGEELNKLCAGVCAILRFPMECDEETLGDGTKNATSTPQAAAANTTSTETVVKKTATAGGKKIENKKKSGGGSKGGVGDSARQSKWKVGDAVSAKYSDGGWYNAKVTGVLTGGQYEINYVDYDELATVGEKAIKKRGGKKKAASSHDDGYDDKYDKYDDY